MCQVEQLCNPDCQKDMEHWVLKLLTILNTLVNKKALKQAGARESEGDKVTVVVFNNSDLTNPI